MVSSVGSRPPSSTPNAVSCTNDDFSFARNTRDTRRRRWTAQQKIELYSSHLPRDDGNISALPWEQVDDRDRRRPSAASLSSTLSGHSMRACRDVPVFYFPTQLNLFCQIPHSLLTEGNPNSMSRHSQRLPLSASCKTIRGDLFYALSLLSPIVLNLLRRTN